MCCETRHLLVIGKQGQLARSIAKIAPDFPQLQISYSSRSELDLAVPGSVERYFNQNRYDLILNSAAYTAVDQAERELEQAAQINLHAVGELAMVAREQRIPLIHVSTDYVFDGAKNTPYLESDPTNPASVYGSSKLKGEQVMQQIAPSGFIVRTSWLYSEFGNNFVKTMLCLGKERDQLNIVYDQVGSPTYATDLARSLLMIAAGDDVPPFTSKVPVFHYANHGIGSWYDFAHAIFELSGVDCEAHPVTSAEYPTVAKRPHYSVLSTEKIKQQFQFSISHWRDSLRLCLEELKESDR